MARDYELGIIINPDVGDDQARTTVERVTQYVIGNGGQVVRVNAQGRRHLAYPIEHHRDGLYFWFDLILDPESVAGLERNIGVNEDIIRHLVKLRDPRVIQQVRQREAEADAQAAAQAAARAEREAEAQAAAAAGATAPAEPVEGGAHAEAQAEPAADDGETETKAEVAEAEE
jgi:small subunit ribosomal protein S6